MGNDPKGPQRTPNDPILQWGMTPKERNGPTVQWGMTPKDHKWPQMVPNGPTLQWGMTPKDPKGPQKIPYCIGTHPALQREGGAATLKGLQMDTKGSHAAMGNDPKGPQMTPSGPKWSQMVPYCNGE